MALFNKMGAKGHTKATRVNDYLRSVLQSGTGRYVPQLQRLTFRVCKKNPDCKHLRNFVKNELPKFSVTHPSTVVYVVTETDTKPKVKAEFLNGRSETANLRSYPPNEILELVNTWSTRSGKEIVRLLKHQKTDFPSIQGEWHNFTNKKDYDITKTLDWKDVSTRHAWEPLECNFKKYYRKTELHKLENYPVLTKEEKSELPLGKWGPVLDPEY